MGISRWGFEMVRGENFPRGVTCGVWREQRGVEEEEEEEEHVVGLGSFGP